MRFVLLALTQEGSEQRERMGDRKMTMRRAIVILSGVTGLLFLVPLFVGRPVTQSKDLSSLSEPSSCDTIEARTGSRNCHMREWCIMLPGAFGSLAGGQS